MTEFNFRFEHIDPLEFCGANNSKLSILKKAFPEVRITSRGDVLKIAGNDEPLDEFKQKFNLILDHYAKKTTISDDELTMLLIDEGVKWLGSHQTPATAPDEALVYGNNGSVIKAKTPNQRLMVVSAMQNDITFAIGPAGSGKTYTAVALAVRALKQKEVKKIILTRPAVEAGENLGFLPGDLKEKIDPYLRPLYDALGDMLPPAKLSEYIQNGTIEIAPLAFMRGRTLDKSFVILDEAQNTTPMQIKMFLTRMGPSAKYIITGDLTQIDLPRHQSSGLAQTINVLKDIKEIGFVYLTVDDVVRHRLVKQIVKAYEKFEEKTNR